jgi:hypothetical protein
MRLSNTSSDCTTGRLPPLIDYPVWPAKSEGFVIGRRSLGEFLDRLL